MLTYRAIDIETLARTLYGETRGEPQVGKEAVAWVIRNRSERPGWWSRNPDEIPDDTIEAVCRDPYQFTCWQDANKEKLLAVTLDNEAFRQCLLAAAAVLADMIVDPTGGADHYHAVQMDPYPAWSGKMQRTTKIGNHVFYAPAKPKEF